MFNIGAGIVFVIILLLLFYWSLAVSTALYDATRLEKTINKITWISFFGIMYLWFKQWI